MQTILIVDDDPDFLAVAQKILAPAMCRLLTADTGAKALEIAAREQPDLILLDVSLPDIDGLELCRRIKADPDMGRSHVLFVSSVMTNPENQAQGLLAGGDGFMTKSVNTQYLLAQVQATLRIKRTEDALRLERAQVLSIFDSMGQYSYVVDPHTHEILFANKAMQTAYGMTLEGRICHEVLQGADHPCPICDNADVLQHPDQIYQRELDNPVLGQHLLITERVIKWPDGRDVIFKFGLDATERIKAEQALRHSQERFQLAMDATRDGLWDWDVETNDIYFSPAYTTMLGYAPGEIVPSIQFWSDNVHPDDLPLAWERITECLENRQEMFEVEFRMRTKAGAWLWIQGRGNAVSRDQTGKATRMVGTHMDISEHKAIQDRLQEAMRRAEAANRAKSEFLANMSHEIRTPMNGVIGLSRLLLDTPLTPEQQDLAGTILSSAEVLLGLINDILDLSKVESGKLELEVVPFDLAQLLDELISIMSHRARGKQLSLSSSMPPNVPSALLGDPLRLRQIMINLMENALKFTDEGGVAVRVERAEGNAGMLGYWNAGIEKKEKDNAGMLECWDAGIGEAENGKRKVESEMFVSPTVPPSHCQTVVLRFSVRDTGIGIAEDKLAGVFEKFQQVDASSTRKYGGSGLGLAITRQLVELMGGEMGVQSRVGQGSEFWFVIPLAVHEQKTSLAAPSKREHTPSSAKAAGYPQFVGRVLLVEDNQVNQTVALGILKKLGVEASVATNGLEALQALEQSDYDLVLMDVQMPVMDGLCATREIRRRENNAGMLEYWNAGIEKTEKDVGITEQSDRHIEDTDSTPKPSAHPCIPASHHPGIPESRHSSIPASQHPRIPVIAMTAGAMQEDRERSQEAGMDGHLTKPIDPRLLIDVLARWLPKRKLETE